MRFKNGLGVSLVLIGGLVLSPMTSLAETVQSNAPVRNIGDIQVDKKQLRQAVASRTLTWLTGSSSNNDYVSVGRLANFFGFVGLRVSSGHSLSRSAVAKETLHVLNGSQRGALIELVETQKDVFEQVRTARFNMNRALEGLLVGEDISKADFLELGEIYGASEAELGRFIGQTLGEVATSLSPEQKTALNDIRQKHISGQAGTGKIKGIKTNLPKKDKKELVNIAARLLSWTTGDETFNDFEVVGKPSQHFGFVSLRIESNHGVKRGAVADEVWSMLTAEQQSALELSADQNIDMFDEFLQSRGVLMRTLEVALKGQVIDKKSVRSLGQKVGQYEAEMTWAQAQAMLEVRRTMTEAQSTDLLAMRAKYTGGSYKALPTDSFSRGRQLFAQCVLCHSEANESAMGPSLKDLIGRPIANDAHFANYSNSMKSYAQANGNWTETLLDNFLSSPRETVPGTYMGFDGLENSEDSDAIILYLKDRE